MWFGSFSSYWATALQQSWLLSLSPEYNISAAAISIFSLAFMIFGSLCLVGSCTGKSKGRDYLLKPAGMFFAFAGELSFTSLRGHSQVSLRAALLRFHPPLLLRSLCLHLTGGDASVSQAHDRERGDDLDRVPLRLVLRLRLHRLRPPLPHRHCAPRPLHAPDAQEPVGDLHGRRAGASRVMVRETDKCRLTVSFVWSANVRFISRTRACHQIVRSKIRGNRCC